MELKAQFCIVAGKRAASASASAQHDNYRLHFEVDEYHIICDIYMYT